MITVFNNIIAVCLSLSRDDYEINGQYVVPLNHDVSKNNIGLLIPLHDGVIIQGTKQNAELTKTIFEDESLRYFGAKLPTKIKELVVNGYMPNESRPP